MERAANTKSLPSRCALPERTTRQMFIALSSHLRVMRQPQTTNTPQKTGKNKVKPRAPICPHPVTNTPGATPRVVQVVGRAGFVCDGCGSLGGSLCDLDGLGLSVQHAEQDCSACVHPYAGRLRFHAVSRAGLAALHDPHETVRPGSARTQWFRFKFTHDSQQPHRTFTTRPVGHRLQGGRHGIRGS